MDLFEIIDIPIYVCNSSYTWCVLLLFVIIKLSPFINND